MFSSKLVTLILHKSEVTCISYLKNDNSLEFFTIFIFAGSWAK